MLDNIANGFYMKNPRIKSMNGIVLSRPNMSSYKKFTKVQLETMDMKTIPVGAFSASFIRNLVKYGLKDKFVDVYSPYLNEDKINELYSAIENGINTLPENKKRETPSKPLKYVYPLIKDEIGLVEPTLGKTKLHDDTSVNISVKRRRIRGGRKSKKNSKKYPKKYSNKYYKKHNKKSKKAKISKKI